MNEFALRNKIAEAKADLHEKGGRDDYWGEILAWVLQDYHGSMGSVMDFTEDDWLACKENGWTLDEVCKLCDEEQFSSDVFNLADFFATLYERTTIISKEEATDAVDEFYTWQNDLLPIVEKVYSNS